MTPEQAGVRLVKRCLLLSGWIELTIGTGHNVLATLILLRPATVASVIAALGWPPSILTPIEPPAQRDLVLAMSLGAGTSWMLFGALLIWQGHSHPERPYTPLLVIVLAQQISFLVLLLLLVRFHVPAILAVTVMTAALGTGLTRTLRTK